MILSYADCITKYGKYQVALKSCGGTKGKMYKTVIETNIDKVFIVDKEKNMYLIPKDLIENKLTINLCEKYSKFKVVL